MMYRYIYKYNMLSTKQDYHIHCNYNDHSSPDLTIPNVVKYADKHFLIASFHTKYHNKQVWLQALERAIENPNVDVIGHIASEPSFTLGSDEIEQLAKMIVHNNKTVELNAKYHRPPKKWIQIFRKNGVHFHLGSDAHSLDEIGRFENISDLIALTEGHI